MADRAAAALFLRCYRNELEKVACRPRNRAVPAATAMICALWAAAVWFLNGGALAVTFNLAFSPLTVLAFIAELYIPALTLLLAADIYTAEVRNGAARVALASGVRASALFWAKFLAVATYCEATVAALYAFALVIATLLPVRGFGARDAAESLVAYVATAAPMLAMAAMATLFANLFRSGFSAVTFGFAAYAALKVAGSFSGTVASAAFTTFMQWHILWVGRMPSAQRMLGIALLFASTGAACLSGGYLAFSSNALKTPTANANARVRGAPR